MKLDLAFALENAAWPVFLVDDSGNVRHANPAAVNILGTVMEGESALAVSIWSPENQLSAKDFLHRAERATTPPSPVKFRVRGGGTTSFNTYVCPLIRDHQRFFVFQLLEELAAEKEPAYPAPDPASPGSFGSSKNGKISDTALLRAAGYTSEGTAAQKQKLDCALQLARTLALDFNNALTAILGHASLILGKIEPTHPWRSSMIEIEKSAQRAAELAQDLAGFSRQEKDVRMQAAGNLNSVVRRAVESFQRPGAKSILWTLQLEKRLFAANFDEAKVQQAILKVLENAVEAVGNDGRISVRTFTQIVAEPVLSPALQLGAGHYVCVEISDNGSGIPKEVLPRVFEPFFTTKGGAQHRGLGLAWVYGIVTNHGGNVAVISPPGQGTTVRVFLPAQEKFIKDQGTRVDDLRGNQTVLIVDDEETLLTLGQTVLAGFGYKVLTASSGQRALEIFGQAPTQIHLVITDMVMPGMSGREFSDNLRRLSATVPILCTSGYVRGPAEPENDAVYLRKPYTSQDLLRKVKQVLNPSPPSGDTTRFAPKV